VTDRPLEPDEPTEPTQPEELAEPTEPEEPTEVTGPTEETEAVEPGEPEETPLEPDEPTAEEETTAVAPAAPAEKRLYRSRDDRVVAGVCGGLGKYLNIDPVLVRIAAVLLIFAGGVGIVLYVIGWIAIDEEPAAALGADGTVVTELVDDDLDRRRGAVVLGLIFVAVGIFYLLDDFWPDLDWKYIWPIALIAVGFAIVARGRR
jgi:phage shock protein C